MARHCFTLVLQLLRINCEYRAILNNILDITEISTMDKR